MSHLDPLEEIITGTIDGQTRYIQELPATKVLVQGMGLSYCTVQQGGVFCPKDKCNIVSTYHKKSSKMSN